MFLTIMAIWCDHLLYQAFFYGGRVMFSVLHRGVSWFYGSSPQVIEVIEMKVDTESQTDSWEYV